MATLDKAMGKVAKRLVKAFGRPAVLRHVTAAPTYNPPTGRAHAPTTDITCEVVFEEFGQGQLDGTLVQAGDRKAIVARMRIDVEPTGGADVLIEGGRTWRIVRVIGYSSGEQEAAYTLQVRR